MKISIITSRFYEYMENDDDDDDENINNYREIY